MPTLDTWVTRTAGGQSHRKIAEQIGIGHGVLSRWIREDTRRRLENDRPTFPLANLLEFCRVYGGNFLEAMILAGYATDDEVQSWTPRLSVREVDDVALLAELQLRATARKRAATATGPVHVRDIG